MNNLETKRIIKFYRANGEFGFLSNLYKKPLKFEDKNFPTAEHAYQFGKFKDPETREWAMMAPKPHLLSIISHGLFSWDIVENWSKIKLNRMRNVLRAKFFDPELRKKLLETKNAILIENSKSDAYWGIGKSGNGKNMLGKLLMDLRKEILMEEIRLSSKDPFKHKCIECGIEMDIKGTFRYGKHPYWECSKW